jgi:hypothetical protein
MTTLKHDNIKEARVRILAEFKEPKYPYILFAARKIQSIDGTGYIRYQPNILRACGSEQGGTGLYPGRIQQYISKGWEILKWRMPSEQEKAKLRDPQKGYSDFGADKDHWAEIEALLLQMTGATSNKVAELIAEKDALQKMVTELQAAKKAAVEEIKTTKKPADS